ERDHIATRRTERRTNGDLACTAGDGVRRDPIHTQRRQPHTDQTKPTCDHRDQALREQTRGYHLFQRPHRDGRQTRVHRLDERTHTARRRRAARAYHHIHGRRIVLAPRRVEERHWLGEQTAVLNVTHDADDFHLRCRQRTFADGKALADR